MRVGVWLLAERNKLKIQEVANLLNVNRRTLSNWKKEATGKQKRIGRPSHSDSAKFRVLIKVGREWKKQACPGWRPVKYALGKEVPTRLLQLQIKKLKFLKRKHQNQNLRKNRLSVKVKYKNVYWSQDGAHLKQRKYQVIKDRASLVNIAVKQTTKDNSEEVIASIEAAKKNRKLPLVLSTDNGSNYISKEFEIYLSENKIIHLRSLPRTPQHNGAVEGAIREIKEAALINDCSLEVAAEIINKNRLRASFLFKTSMEIDETISEVYPELKRDAFYEKCKQELKKSCAETKKGRSKRMIERKVILETLEQFDLIEINRGGLV